METGIFFATLVIGIGAIHIALQVADGVKKFMGKQTGVGDIQQRAKSKKRDDWYVFFRRQDLTGHPEEEKDTTARKTSSARRTRRSQPRQRAVRM